MPIGALGRLVSEQVAAHDIAWNQAFRARVALMESFQGPSGSELSDSDCPEVPSLEGYQQRMIERHDNELEMSVIARNASARVWRNTSGSHNGPSLPNPTTQEPRDFFQRWAARVAEESHEKVTGNAFKKYWKTILVPIAPLDDSNGAIKYEDVVAWLQTYKALFTAADSVMVLPELHNAYCGIAM